MSATGLQAGGWAGAAVLVAALGLGGCRCCRSGDAAGAPGGAVERGPPPDFATVAAAYNARVEHLDRLWARTTIRFESVDRDGEEISEQGDGHFQFVRARRLYMTVGKVGETGYQLGSNESRYWWIDVRKKTALVGAHERFTPEVGRRSGLPVHPLDLPEVLGVMPLGAPGTGGTVAWGEDGRSLLVRTPMRFGERLLVLEPGNYEPREVHLLDESGERVVSAVLKDARRVELPEESWAPARTSTLIEIGVPSTRTRITLWLWEVQNREIRERSFDLDALLRQYGVGEVEIIDEESVEPAAGFGRADHP